MFNVTGTSSSRQFFALIPDSSHEQAQQQRDTSAPKVAPSEVAPSDTQESIPSQGANEQQQNPVPRSKSILIPERTPEDHLEIQPPKNADLCDGKQQNTLDVPDELIFPWLTPPLSRSDRNSENTTSISNEFLASHNNSFTPQPNLSNTPDSTLPEKINKKYFHLYLTENSTHKAGPEIKVTFPPYTVNKKIINTISEKAEHYPILNLDNLNLDKKKFTDELLEDIKKQHSFLSLNFDVLIQCRFMTHPLKKLAKKISKISSETLNTINLLFNWKNISIINSKNIEELEKAADKLDNEMLKNYCKEYRKKEASQQQTSTTTSLTPWA
jgi:hypothetical protein